MRIIFYVGDENIYDHIMSKTKGERSKYICNLIKNDITNQKIIEKPPTREEIIAMIKKYSNSSDDDINEKIKNSLTDMFR
jgi:hypothetical protein